MSRPHALLAAAFLGTAALALLGPAAAHAGPDAAGNLPDGRAAAPNLAAVAPLEAPRFAVVASGSSPILIRGKNAVSATRLAAGNYEVVFDRDIRGCAYVATPGNPGGGNPTSGQVAVAQRSGNPNAVYVDTRDSSGVSADRFFHLVVVC